MFMSLLFGSFWQDVLTFSQAGKLQYKFSNQYFSFVKSVHTKFEQEIISRSRHSFGTLPKVKNSKGLLQLMSMIRSIHSLKFDHLTSISFVFSRDANLLRTSSRYLNLMLISFNLAVSKIICFSACFNLLNLNHIFVMSKK